MTIWLKNRFTGKVYKGKANSWSDVEHSLSYGDVLYNPYTGRTVYGWNNYKQDLSRSQRNKF